MSSVKKIVKKTFKAVKKVAKTAFDPREWVKIGKKALTGLGLVPEMPKLPDMPDINVPTAGLQQAQVAGTGPEVSLETTENRRRQSGSGKGKRKLRVPLGGLR